MKKVKIKTNKHGQNFKNNENSCQKVKRIRQVRIVKDEKF